MFDLLGFWFNVTVITIFIMFPSIFILKWLTKHFVLKVTKDRELADKAGNFVIQSTGNRYNPYETTIFNRIKLPVERDGLVVPVIMQVIVLCILGIYILTHETTLVDVVSNVSSALAPYTGVLALFIIVYYGVIYICSKLFVLQSKINTILKED